MICSFCGSVVPRGAAFCSQCGAPQPKDVDQRERLRARGFDHWGPNGEGLAGEVEGHEQVVMLPQAQQQPYLLVPLQSTLHWQSLQASATTASAFAPAVEVPDFRRRAIAAFLLYLAFFVPGVIASLVWWSQAKRFEMRTGITPRGKRSLSFLLAVGVIFSILFLMARVNYG